MREDFSPRDIVSLAIGIISLILSIYFIKDNVTKLIVVTGIILILISSYFVLIFKDLNTNEMEIKKIKEKMDIYERLNRLEAMMTYKGDRK
ncbi:MAG: hypothetical protein QT02_C0010G0020 [archaeon GW2011_AR9]|nr:MAG: hypothetical protein QT02_C0010G0020 [archaeon GW2011_AR9]MBS3120156.1 hypothetical protein [Candidatus Woesearchaeota archaeon]HIG92585.1 hypothetical protein [Candidatus Woesearchaeota archaeon]HIH12235.1 hypothetical protein [Candidatus Woesearchaeota archaeon]